ncbi:MAG TPA: lysophospholipid acyltransferase family protein [Alphaproteobacteria bacterium]|nr:lysophospholipid acyltransferase family protein [Alphaproteobacteria bacterium]
MTHNRAASAAFTVSFYTWSIFMGLAMIPTLVLPRPVMRACVRLWISGIVMLLRRLAGIDMAVTGRENLPAPPYIVASKHQSEWEADLFNVLVPDPVYVIKKELARIPLYGFYAVRMGMIFIDRRGGARTLRLMLRRAQNAVAAKRPIVIFPEGTRVAVGNRIPYHSGVAALYTALDVPVVPVVHNSGMHWPKQTYRKYPGTIRLKFLPPIPAGLKAKDFLARLEGAMEVAWEELYAAESGRPLEVVRAELAEALRRNLAQAPQGNRTGTFSVDGS